MITHFVSSSLCQSGLRATIFSYSSAAILLLILTIIPFQSIASFLFSKCSTISLATRSNLSSDHTIASSLAHFDLSFCFQLSSSASVISSNSLSIFGLFDSSKFILASLGSK